LLDPAKTVEATSDPGAAVDSTPIHTPKFFILIGQGFTNPDKMSIFLANKLSIQCYGVADYKNEHAVHNLLVKSKEVSTKPVYIVWAFRTTAGFEWVDFSEEKSAVTGSPPFLAHLDFAKEQDTNFKHIVVHFVCFHLPPMVRYEAPPKSIQDHLESPSLVFHYDSDHGLFDSDFNKHQLNLLLEILDK
jgi:hypothetical protein